MKLILLYSTVVSQHYDTDVNKEYAITGNSAILKCQVPSFVADFITVLSWHTDKKDDIYPGENYGLIHKLKFGTNVPQILVFINLSTSFFELTLISQYVL